MDNRNLKILFKNYKNWRGVPAVLVFSIIITIGLVQEIEKNKIIFEQLNQVRPITFDKNGDAKKPLHCSLNTNYLKVVVTYSNDPPTVKTPTLNGGDSITLTTGGGTTTVSGTTTITDTDGWDDISSATSTLFRNGAATSCSSGTANPNWCYYMSSSDCTLGATPTASSRNVTCSTNVWFLAEPTAGTSSMAGEWQIDITAKDALGKSDTGTTSQDLNTLYYFDITGSIDYGTMNPGATSSESTTTATNQGNCQIDLELSGVAMEDVSGHSIIPDQQHYYGSSLGDWGGKALTSTAASFYNLVDLPKPTATTSDSYDDIYWMIKVPAVQASGTYSGTNTVSAIGIWTCGGLVVDIDGNTYNTVLIEGDSSSQCWMKENMATTHYPDRNPITKGPSEHGTSTWGDADHGYYSCPPNTDNDEEDCAAATGTAYLGMLYQWSAAMNGTTTAGAQGICPTGWHVPTDAEIKILEGMVDSTYGVGNAEWDGSGWRGDDVGSHLSSATKDGDNSSGFTGLLAGYRRTNGDYYRRDVGTIMWSSDQHTDSTYAWSRRLYYSLSGAYRTFYDKAYGYSVRCLMD